MSTMNTTNVRKALYGKMAGDTTLNNLLATPPAGYSKSIFYALAPAGAAFPYVIFHKQAGTPRNVLANGGPGYQEDVWLIKGVDHPDGTDSDVAESIQTRLDALLTDATLSISGETLLALRRESDQGFAEVQNGETYQHAGALFRLVHATT